MIRLNWFFIFCFLTSPAWATPPTEIKLLYDSSKQLLHVEAQHPSSRLERHFLHKLVITQNSTEVQTLYFTRQTQPWGMSTDIALPAKGGDQVNVHIWCIQGGEGSADIVIPAAQKETKKTQ